MAVQKAVCIVFIREIREIRGSIPLVAAVRAGRFVLFRGYVIVVHPAASSVTSFF